MEKLKHTNYEIARILGARALQIAMDAPYLMDISIEKLEQVNYNPMEIAKIELEAGVLPISVKQPMPKKKSVKIKKVTSDEDKKPEEKVIEAEVEEEKEIGEGGEIMELANPEDEAVEEEVGGREGSEELQ